MPNKHVHMLYAPGPLSFSAALSGHDGLGQCWTAALAAGPSLLCIGKNPPDAQAAV